MPTLKPMASLVLRALCRPSACFLYLMCLYPVSVGRLGVIKIMLVHYAMSSCGPG